MARRFSHAQPVEFVCAVSLWAVALVHELVYSTSVSSWACEWVRMLVLAMASASAQVSAEVTVQD